MVAQFEIGAATEVPRRMITYPAVQASSPRTAPATALGRKNALFAGSDGGARHWAVVASLVATARPNAVEPRV
jgi:hypothetical protein